MHLCKKQMHEEDEGFHSIHKQSQRVKQLLTIFQYSWILASPSSTPQNCLLKMSMELLLVRRLLIFNDAHLVHLGARVRLPCILARSSGISYDRN
jgi:hypothetical protein